MTISEIQRALAALAPHPLADTNVEGVEIIGTGLHFQTDASEAELLRSERDDLEAECKTLSEEVETLKKEIADGEQAREDLADKLHEVRDPDSGVTLKSLIEDLAAAKKETEGARKSRDDWRGLMIAAELECKALRKKKGVVSGVVRHAHEVVTLLGYISQVKDGLTRYPEACRKMLAKIDAS